jgi:hypothetical protein
MTAKTPVGYAQRRLPLIRHGLVSLALAWPLLSAPAQAQDVVPLDRLIVLPPVSRQELRDLRDAKRGADRATIGRREENRLDGTSPIGRDNPALGYDVTSGIQQRAMEKALPR